jgi:DNA-binding protein YbaB
MIVTIEIDSFEATDETLLVDLIRSAVNDIITGYETAHNCSLPFEVYINDELDDN